MASSLETLQDYFSLCKPKVVFLMLITTWVSMLLAKSDHTSWKIILSALLGIALLCGAAAIINHCADAGIDLKMRRTQSRPIASGRISLRNALIFSMLLGISGFLCLWFWVNPLTTLLTVCSALGYAICYTLFLKKASPQNIVIGGIFGATPPMLGSAAVSNQITPFMFLLSLIIFLWTPPHFWSLAIYRNEDYQNANIPMLPITHGIPFTKLCILLYTLLLWAVSLLPFAIGACGIFYFCTALILGAIFLYQTLHLYFSHHKILALKTFRFSITYLLLLFIGLWADHGLRG